MTSSPAKAKHRAMPGPATLHRLSYVSRITGATAARLPTAMRDILVESVAHNFADRITGLLICDGEVFAQALEGPRDAVEACFSRILRDPRHIDPAIRERGPASRRSFPRWSMCGLSLSPTDDALLAPPEVGFDLFNVSPGALWQHLEGVALRHSLDLDMEHARLLAGMD